MVPSGSTAGPSGSTAGMLAVVPLQPAVVPPLVSGSTAPGALFHLPSGSSWTDPFAKTFPAVVVLVNYQGASGSTAGGPAVVPLHPAVVPPGSGSTAPAQR